MRNASIASRLVMAFGGQLALFAVFGALVVFAAKAIQGDLKEVTSIAQPMRAAAYEMDISTMGAGLGVVKYLHQPRPEFRARFEKDKADFEHFLSQYRDLSKDAELLALADTLAATHREYSELGEALMALRDRQTVRHRELAEVAVQINRIDDAIPDTPDTGESLAGTRLLLALATDLVEILLLSSDGIQEAQAAQSSGRDERMARLNEEIAQVQSLLRQISELQRTPKEAQWFARLSGVLVSVISLIQEIETAEAATERDLLTFIALQIRIDDILDSEIQVFAGEDLAAANANAEAKLHQIYWMIAMIGVLGILVAGAATVFLSRTIVGPIRQLADAARGISTGNLTCRAKLAGGGELGELGRVFDHMTDSLESAQTALNQSNADLEVQVLERTGSLAATNRQLEEEIVHRADREQALRLAKEAAEVANRGKTVFLANMSHELRTPLNAVIGFSELMQTELLGPIGNEKYRGYITDIHGSAKHLLQLINDILDITKVESGNAKLREEWIELASLAGQCVGLVDWRARDKAISLSVEVAPELPRLWADELRMKQSLTNLLDNALKFTPPGGQITLAAIVTANGDLDISVRDTGIGIAPKDHDMVLTVFGQADSGLDRSYEGAGLGLPLVKLFVEMHGGALTLASAPGAGTRVAITLSGSRLEQAREAAAS